MATVTLNQQSSPFDGVHLRISAGAGPVLELALPANHPWKLEDGGVVAALLGARGELAWGSQSISFRITGFRSTPGGADQVVGIVLSDEVLDWFEQRRSDTAATHTLVYQRQESDANGWAFLRRVLGDKFAVPHGAEALDAWLPVGSCFLRAAGCDNLVHQNRVLGLLANTATQPWGWCAFDAEGSEEPLRLLGLDAPVFELDSDWSPSDLSEMFLPHRALGPSAPATKLRREFGTLEFDDAATVLRELTRSGLEGAVEGMFPGSEQMLCLPTQVGLGGITALCPSISYHFDMRSHVEERQVALQSELQIVPLPTLPALSPRRLTAAGTFVEWTEASQKQRLKILPPDEQWQMMGDGDSPDVETADPEKGLVCEAVTPFASRAGCAGFYVSHRPDDAMLVEITDCEVPRMVGMRQVYSEGLESVDVVLNSETVSISGLAQDADLATADGVAVDGAAGTVEVFAAQHVRLKQKVTVTDENTKLEHNEHVTGSATIDGDTVIGGKTDIEGDTTIAATLEVGV